MASCDLNDRVKFKLTPVGDAIVERYLSEQRATHGVDAGCFYRKDENGYLHLSLWEFAQFFGKYFHIASQKIIENNELIFCGE